MVLTHFWNTMQQIEKIRLDLYNSTIQEKYNVSHICHLKFFSSHTKKCEKKQMELMYFELYIPKILSLPYMINIRIIEILCFLCVYCL